MDLQPKGTAVTPIFSLRARLKSERWVVGALVGISAICIALRAIVLFSYPYPPSGDVAGDLYQAHVWLGRSLPVLNQPLQPPLYYFLVVIPSTSFLPVFTGTRLYMSVIPGLLVFPGYLLCREVGANRRWSLAGAALVGSASAYSLMVTWNAAFNLLGIFFLMFFLVALSRALRLPGWKAAIATGGTFGLVVGTHPLTTFIASTGLFVTAFGYVLLWRRPWRVRLVNIGRILSACTLFALPFATIYTGLLTSTVGTGTATYGSQIQSAAHVLLFYPFGFQGLVPDPLAFLDAAVAILACACLARFGTGSAALVLVSLLFGAVGFAFVDAANVYRGLYFLTIPFIAGIPLFLEYFASGKLGFPRPRARARGGPKVPETWRTVQRFVLQRNTRIAGTVLFAVALVCLNVSASVVLLQQGAASNRQLNPQLMELLDWAKANTSASTVFYLAPSLAAVSTWFWSYSFRVSYAPVPLEYEATPTSASDAVRSDLLATGNYVAYSSSLALGFDMPGPENDPTVYLSVLGYWYPLLVFNSGNTFATFARAGESSVSLPLVSAALISEETNQTTGTEVFGLWWAQYQEGLSLAARVTSSAVELGWTSNTTQTLSVDAQYQIPPSGYNFYYVDVPASGNTRGLVDSFDYAQGAFSVEMDGGEFSQSTSSSTLWTTIDFSGGSDLNLSFPGLPTAGGWSFTDSRNIAGSLNINAVVLNTTNDYDFFTRINSNTPNVTRLEYSLEFETGDLQVYSVELWALEDAAQS